VAEQDPWIAVIGKALAYLCLKQALGNATIVEKAVFLEGLGIPRDDAAEMLGTSAKSIADMLRAKKKARGNAKAKKS
jgi:hypothetical protein